MSETQLGLVFSKAEDEPDELGAIVAEFSSKTYPEEVDRDSALIHAKAQLVAAAAGDGRAVDGEAYFRALNAVSSTTARSTSDVDLASHLAGAEALADLAAARLYQRGVHTSASGYSDAFVAEIGAISRESGLEYRPTNKGA